MTIKNGLKLRTGTNLELDDLKNGATHLIEAVISHQSGLLSKSIKQSKFRSRYIGYQTNLIVYGRGGYRFIDYIKIGTQLSLLVMVTAITVIYNMWF